MLRSSSTLLLDRTDYNMKTYGDRAFAISAPELWNQLPDDIRCGYTHHGKGFSRGKSSALNFYSGKLYQGDLRYT